MHSTPNARHFYVILLAKSLIFVGLMWALSGCAPTFKFGSPPKTDALAELTPRLSSSSDVLRILGQPPGRGMTEHRKGERSRDIWFYRYIVAEGMEANMQLLFVFMDGNIYDGHLWFSSVHEFNETVNRKL